MSPSRLEPWRERALTGLMTAAAVVGLVVAGGQFRDSFGARLAGAAREARAPMPPRPVRGWDALRAGGTWSGPRNARVVLVNFSDYECPACATFHQTLERMRRRYPHDFAVSYRHFPLERTHPSARAAAIAAECAAQQGRFEEFTRAVFGGQELVGLRPFSDFARDAGVPEGQVFQACVASGEPEERISADLAAGEAVGATGTPTVILQGKLLPVPPASEELDRMIAGLLSSATEDVGNSPR